MPPTRRKRNLPPVEYLKGTALPRAKSLSAISAEVAACHLCELSMSRNNTVPGEGPKEARVMVIGEAPGRKEDSAGRPFVGSAGRILTAALTSAGVVREQLYITNVVKCRPPGNRAPTEEEVVTCTGAYLARQMELIKPKLVVLLGKTALRAVTGRDTFPEEPLIRTGSVDYLCTYHPASTIYNREYRKKFLRDVKSIKRYLSSQNIED